MRISIFGAGYVGLVTAACFADAGYSVVCTDINSDKIDSLQQANLDIYEPGLLSLIRRSTNNGNLSFTTCTEAAVTFAEIIFIAVGTPTKLDGSTDLTYINAVAYQIAQYLEKPTVIANKSTVPVGTCDAITKIISSELSRLGKDVKFEVCANPEFLKQGTAINDFTHCERIIIGTQSDWAQVKLKECYAALTSEPSKLLIMDTKSAELTKQAANSMLATRISFINEIANVAERVGADIHHVQEGIGSDSRIGPQFLAPGCGFGGSCLPKDLRSLIHTARHSGYDPKLLSAVASVNNQQKNTLYKKLKQAFNNDLSERVIALWGLSFKPNTDDMRDAPSLELIDSLLQSHAKIIAYDPQAMGTAKYLFNNKKGIQFVETKEDAVLDADALVVCTEWDEFRTIDLNWIKQSLKFPIIVDGRNIFRPEDLHKAGILYYGIGTGRLH